VIAEGYDCARDCQARDGTWDAAARSARGCTLVGVEPVERKPTARALYQLKHGSAYMGRYPDKRLAGAKVLGLEQRTDTPFEDPALGCPGGYYRTAFVDSVWPYTRRRTTAGGRVPNPRFDSAPPLVQQAVMALENEEERWHAFVDAEAAKRERKAMEKARKGGA